MPEIAEIFRDHHEEYFRRNNAPPEVIRAIFDIEKTGYALDRSAYYPLWFLISS